MSIQQLTFLIISLPWREEYKTKMKVNEVKSKSSRFHGTGAFGYYSFLIPPFNLEREALPLLSNKATF
jgi:hypothetical protein